MKSNIPYIIIQTFICITLLLSGCITNNSSDDVKNAQINDLILTVDIDNHQINKSLPIFNLSIVLMNKAKNPVKVLSSFDINSTISIELTNEDLGDRYNNILLDQLELEYVTLEPNNNRMISITHNNIVLLNQYDTKEIFHFSVEGNYKLIARCKFNENEPLIESNELTISIE